MDHSIQEEEMDEATKTLADEGIQRLEAAIERGIAAGLSARESVDRHVDALFATYPSAARVMLMRAVELSERSQA